MKERASMRQRRSTIVFLSKIQVAAALCPRRRDQMTPSLYLYLSSEDIHLYYIPAPRAPGYQMTPSLYLYLSSEDIHLYYIPVPRAPGYQIPYTPSNMILQHR